MTYDKQIKYGRWLTLLGYFSLMASIYLWHLVFNQTEKHLISLIILFQIGPLLFPLRGLLNGKTYTHAWSMYLAIYYFIVGVWYAAGKQSLLFGLIVINQFIIFYRHSDLHEILGQSASGKYSRRVNI